MACFIGVNLNFQTMELPDSIIKKIKKELLGGLTKVELVKWGSIALGVVIVLFSGGMLLYYY